VKAVVASFPVVVVGVGGGGVVFFPGQTRERGILGIYLARTMCHLAGEQAQLFLEISPDFRQLKIRLLAVISLLYCTLYIYFIL
jgi:hypothetical protein